MSKESSECLVNLEKQKSCLKSAIISNREKQSRSEGLMCGVGRFYVFNFVLSNSWRAKEIDWALPRRLTTKLLGMLKLNVLF